MKPPEAPRTVPGDGSTGAGPAVLPSLAILKRRADFLRANGGRRQGTPGFLLQARRRAEGESSEAAIRVGFTCSRKVGNAVMRNRAKRRLREAARAVVPTGGRAGWDYVLIGRREATARRPFCDLCADLEHALRRLHAPSEPASSS